MKIFESGLICVPGILRKMRSLTHWQEPFGKCNVSLISSETAVRFLFFEIKMKEKQTRYVIYIGKQKTMLGILWLQMLTFSWAGSQRP